MPDPAQPIERKLAAIFAADVAGYSRLMGQDEVGTLRTLSAHREIMDRLIAEHRGRIANTAGDSVLAEFPSVVDAVQCAVQVQEALAEANAGVSEDRRMSFRIGVHVGDVMVRGGDLLGDGVNVAARLQALAGPGEVCLSEEAHQYVRKVLSFAYVDLGHQNVRNIEKPVRAFTVASLGGRQIESPLAKLNVTSSAPDKPAIAVLPLNVFGGSPELESLADGIAEDVITELSRIGSLAVVARNSTFAYKGQRIDVKQAGRELGARYVIEGSVRQAGGRIRVTAQLIEVSTGNHVWAERYDRAAEDSFDLQDNVTRSVVASVENYILRNEGLLIERSGKTSLSIAEQATLGWKQVYQLTPEGLHSALQIWQSMVEIAPASSKGHQLVAAAAYHRTMMGFVKDIEECRQKALTSGREAVKLEANDEYSHWILAGVLANLFGRLDEAIPIYHLALELNPNFALGHGSMGMAYAHCGYPEQAIEHTRRAIQMNPRDPSIFFRYSAMAISYYLLGEFAQAVDWAQRALARKPNWWVSHAVAIASLWAEGRHDEAEGLIPLRQNTPLLRANQLPISRIATGDRFANFRGALVAAGLPE